jgi:hypothetical protein
LARLDSVTSLGALAINTYASCPQQLFELAVPESGVMASEPAIEAERTLAT